mmetsp:Transcript_44029/g.79019  ORF Transcript_44029/g.79019 Transcript_44029/m.79019 type:complete len:94 (+) Transcript_44029:558-839(+)
MGWDDERKCLEGPLVAWQNVDDDGKNGQEVNEKFHGVEEHNLEGFVNTVDVVHKMEVVNRAEALNRVEVVYETWMRVDYIRDGIHDKGGYLAN